jgi:hypothetical protein
MAQRTAFLEKDLSPVGVSSRRSLVGRLGCGAEHGKKKEGGNELPRG